MTNKSVEIRDLLSIDVAAEIRKLARAQLESPAQLPVELVRRSLASGAHAVAVTASRRGIAVRDDGAPLAPAILDSLATLFDEAAAAGMRHEALLALERAGHLALLALAGSRVSGIRVRSGGRELTWRPGTQPVPSAVQGDGTTVEILGGRIDAALVREALTQACRFSAVPVTIDGRAVPRGAGAFGEVVREEALASPLSGRVALPLAGETARVWITLDGIVAAHLAVPGAPCFEACVEARSLLSTHDATPSASALRETVGAHLDAITGQAIEVIGRAAASLPRATPRAQLRIRELVLTTMRRKLAPPSLRGVPVIRAVRAGTEERLLSVDEVAALGASAPGGAIIALFPGHDPARFLLPGGDVPVLDAVERGRLSSILDVSFRPPHPRRLDASALARLAALAAAGRHALRSALRRLRDPFGAKPVAEAALSPSERAFAEGLARQLMDESFEGVAVRFVEGAGPVRRASRGRVVLLPRRNAAVAAAVRAAGRDPGWIYVAALAFESAPRPGARSLYWR